MPLDMSDSDLEIDQDELGPNGVGSMSAAGPFRNDEMTGNGIPLRQLDLRRARHERKDLGASSSSTGDRSLTDTKYEEEVFSSGGSGVTDDHVPLLPGSDLDEGVGAGEGSGRHRKTLHNEASRNFAIGQYPPPRFPPNAVSNAKYTPWSFLPKTLWSEFSFFFNLYFLLVALSQIVPSLRIGYLSTYIAPLAFVLAITLGKEALDDIARRKRDAEANKEEYTVLRLNDRKSSLQSSIRSRKHKFSSRNPPSQRKGQYARLDTLKEEEDDIEAHGPLYGVQGEAEELRIRSRDLKVGDVVKLSKDQRVPADLVILRAVAAETPTLAQHSRDTKPSSPELVDRQLKEADPMAGGPNESGISQHARSQAQPSDDVGEAFIRTDQLDGETDWKLRLALPLTQKLSVLDYPRLRIIAGRPERNVNEFVGSIEYTPPPRKSVDDAANADENILSSAITIDNTAWANTVLASNAHVFAVVVYTGSQTRQALSTSPSRSKSGLLENEINNLTKILCALTLTLSVALVAIRGAEGRPGQQWHVAVLRFLVLFSTIVPISLRVNLDLGKSVYARFIERDQGIPETVVRTSTIPEELGRIEYLLSDKTGTLTQNEMDLRKIHVGTVSYANEAMEEVRSYVKQGFSTNISAESDQNGSLVTPSSSLRSTMGSASNTRNRREISSRVRDLVLALALCHNVTPTSEEVGGKKVTSYQASSPDEIAIVRWTEQVGLRLFHRDRHNITLQSVDSSKIIVRVEILDVFPFTSAGKRMGIILKFHSSATSSNVGSDEVWFYQKGADTVMGSIVAANDWLDEETSNMAREGLRTLVIGRKRLSEQQYKDFSSQYKQASLSLQDRDSNMSKVISQHLEHNLELLGVTGVEDKLQRDVKPSLELLRNAGVKIWMLTGDKVETARCVAIQARLVSRTQHIYAITQLSSQLNPTAAQDSLSLLRSRPDSTALLIDGDSLSYLLNTHQDDFISVAVQLPAVIACRCSPTQKADVAYLIRKFTKKRVACIGDGGNDVSMIQAADVGVGIVGKEGRQASLAADFSITSFHHLTKLLVWHGRNSYKRSAKLAQFVIHRGLIISVCQTFYSIATELQPHALYRDWLLVGYATVYTMAPVFSLVLDKDVDEGLANLYPELYKELTLGRSLSYKTFFIWVAVSIYQGGIIQGCSQLLVDRDSDRMVSVSFSVLVLNELVMVAFEIVTWHWIMYVSILGTALVYVGSIPFLGGYFDLEYMWSLGFAWRVAAISALSLIPPYSIKLLRRTLHPPSYRKVQGL